VSATLQFGQLRASPQLLHSSEVENPVQGILFHDGNNRSMEQLATDLAKNAMMHNLAIELLRKQFQQMDMALKEKVV
jgi:flagellar basal body rod protein FlgB